jgi:hypothetical protein
MMLTNGKELNSVQQKQKKKTKKKVDDIMLGDYSAEINAENRKAEAEDDETSDSSSESSSSSDDENARII